MRPSIDKVTIDARLGLVDLLLQNNTAFKNVLKVLGEMPDLDKMLAGKVMFVFGMQYKGNLFLVLTYLSFMRFVLFSLNGTDITGQHS